MIILSEVMKTQNDKHCVSFFFLFVDVSFDMCPSYEMPIKGHEIIKDKQLSTSIEEEIGICASVKKEYCNQKGQVMSGAEQRKNYKKE